MRLRRPSPSTVGRLAPAVLATALLASGCGGADPAPAPGADPAGGATGGATEGATQDDREPLDVVTESVDTTLAVPGMTIASQATLQVGTSSFGVFTDGSAAWDDGVADLEFGVEEADSTTTVRVLGDGTDAWVSVEGPQAPAFPDGATWVASSADDLAGAGSFSAVEFLAAVVALRGADEVEEFDTETHDGVTTRVFSTTVAYTDAVAAAGEDADAFRTALSLTGPAEQSDLEMDVAVGPDGVIRTFDLSISSEADVSGGYDIDLADVGREVTAPPAPDPDEVATGPEAQQAFAQLLDS